MRVLWKRSGSRLGRKCCRGSAAERAIWAAICGVVLLLAGCAGGGSADRLTVFAASSLTDVFRDVTRVFEESHPNAKVTIVYAASSTLRAQLEHGARADLFASADQRQMEFAQEAGVIDGEPVTFAINRLAIIVPVAAAAVASLSDLSRDGVKLAVASAHTPIGVYTEAVLLRIAADPEFGPAFVAKIRSNVVIEALNVRQTVAIVEIGEVDAALAYRTDVAAGESLRAIPLPERVNVDATYPIAAVMESEARALARQFIELLLSEQGRAILERHGFGSPS